MGSGSLIDWFRPSANVKRELEAALIAVVFSGEHITALGSRVRPLGAG